jgi:GntR family transcriptional regulator, transcriptional repressor for pyruvate dehydrogenase complex
MDSTRLHTPSANGAITPNLVRQLREMIQSGELPLGSKLLPERELAQKLKVSRSSLRQALKALESMGVLSSRMGMGTFVRTDMDSGSLLSDPMEFVVRTNQISRTKLIEARQFLDVEVVGLTAERGTRESITLIGHQLERMRSASGNPHSMAEADHGFHLAIIRGCQNEVFELIYSPISKFLWEDLSERMHRFDPAETIRLHELIFNAIENRDVEGARQAMKHHLEIGYNTYQTNEAGAAASKTD